MQFAAAILFKTKVEFKKKKKSLEVDQTLLFFFFNHNSNEKRTFSSLGVLVPADSSHQLLSPLYKSSRNQKMKRGTIGASVLSMSFSIL